MKRACSLSNSSRRKCRSYVVADAMDIRGKLIGDRVSMKFICCSGGPVTVICFSDSGYSEKRTASRQNLHPWHHLSLIAGNRGRCAQVASLPADREICSEVTGSHQRA